MSDVQSWVVTLLGVTALVLIAVYAYLKRPGGAPTGLGGEAMRDNLTGLHNGGAASTHLDARIANGDTERAFGGFVVFLIGLDGLNAMRDRLSHAAVDELLRHASARMQTSLRDSDFLARLGGDEFLVVIPQVDDRETAGLVARKLVAALGEPYALTTLDPERRPDGGDGETLVKVSIGISFYPADGADRKALMHAAGAAMNAAKLAGQNQFVFASDLQKKS